jgi:CubicO group peptidase (beta-lactamase class C family)
MIRFGLFSLCICTATLSPINDLKAFWGSEKISPKAERAKKVLEGFDAEVENALREYQVPGVAIGIVVDGYVVYAKGFGLRDREKKLAVTADTLFPIGSCSKAFTTFALGTLVDEGLLNWDDRIIDVVPEFRLLDQHATRTLTLRDLLSHQTGMPRHDFMWYNSQLSRQDIIRRLRYLEPAFDTCDHFHYNNVMYDVCGAAMEKIANKSWEDIISQKILIPLGMARTNFSIIEMQKSADYALPYIEREDGLKRMNIRDFSMVAPAGGMISNITELCRWVQLQIDEGQWQQKPLISPATFKEMHSPQVVATGYPESKEEQIRAYGLGWYVQSYLGYHNIMHDGALDGFTSVISLLPEEDIGIVILSNRNLSALPRLLGMQAFDRLLELPPNDWLKEGLKGIDKSKEMMRETQMKEALNRKKGTHPSHSLEEYVGDYEHPAYGRLKIELGDGTLRAIYNGITLQLEHWHYDVFNVTGESEELFLSLKGSKFTFRNNLNGDIAELIVPFEQKAPDVVFTHKPADTLSALAYLRQFAGTYEIYSYTVEIMLRNQTLFAVIPGQPLYELIPCGKNEFTVKSLAGFSVRFVMDANDQVQEVLLIQPYGIVYTAKPKRS